MLDAHSWMVFPLLARSALREHLVCQDLAARISTDRSALTSVIPYGQIWYLTPVSDSPVPDHHVDVSRVTGFFGFCTFDGCTEVRSRCS